MRIRGLLGVLVLGLAVAAVPAGAQTSIDLGAPETSFWSTGIGNDRGVIFDALVNFDMNGAGIVFDPGTAAVTGLQLEVWQVSGAGLGTRSTLLAAGSNPITNTGAGFYNVGLFYSFVAGNRYELAFNSIPDSEWWNGSNMEFYGFHHTFDPSYSVDGKVTVLDGTETGFSSNTVMPHVQILTGTVVPEPASLLLLGTGLLGVGLVARRREGEEDGA